jgi:hypothetical protein
MRLQAALRPIPPYCLLMTQSGRHDLPGPQPGALALGESTMAVA